MPGPSRCSRARSELPAPLAAVTRGAQLHRAVGRHLGARLGSAGLVHTGAPSAAAPTGQQSTRFPAPLTARQQTSHTPEVEGGCPWGVGFCSACAAGGPLAVVSSHLASVALEGVPTWKWLLRVEVTGAESGLCPCGQLVPDGAPRATEARKWTSGRPVPAGHDP